MVKPLEEGKVRKGGRNPPNTSDRRPPPPKGSGGSQSTNTGRALAEWIIAKLKTLGEYYDPPTDGRSVEHEIMGWLHVLCFHYVQNRRDVKEYDAARRRAKALEAVVQDYMQDHQCAVTCDGPHDDCICIFCRMGAALKAK